MANRPDVTPDTVPADPNAATVTSGAGSSPLGPPSTARDFDEHPASRDYELGAELGRGGMGRVMRARDRRLGREVAIKELIRPGVEARRRFEREARITALLQHPAIVPVYEVVTDGTTEPYYAMRLVGGTTLSDRIAAASPTERLALVRHVLTVAEAMAYAHGQRIIHRDLKASNVIVGDLGETVVIDWGLAKRIGEDDAAAPDAGPSRYTDVRPEDDLTVAGAIMGTPAYMPPEQANGDPIDARADVYSIGAMLYHTLAGAMPYSGRTSREILAEVVAGPPPPLLSRVPEAPRDLAAIVTRAMAREPADRYPSARELAADVSRYMNGQLVASHRYAPRELLARWIRKHRAAVSVAAVAIVVAAAGGTISVRNVIRARDEARADRARADQARILADNARTDATTRADDAILASARLELPRDPRAALERLAKLSSNAASWTQARPLVADALARGVSTILGEIDDITGGAVDADGTVTIAGASGFLVARPDATGHLLRVVDGRALGLVSERALARSTSALSAVANDGSARAWIDRDGHPTVIIDIAGTERRVSVPADLRALAITRGGTTLVAVTDTNVNAIDTATGTARLVGASPQDGGAWRIRLTADESFAVIRRGPAVRVHRLDGAPSNLPEDLWGAATTIDGRWLAYKTQQGVFVRDPDGRTRNIDKAGGGGTLFFSPDARWLAWRTPSESEVHLWDLRAWRGFTLRGHTDIVEDIAFDATGTRLASVSADGTALVHDLSWIDVTNEPFTPDGPSSVIPTFDLGEAGAWVSFAGERLVVATRNGRVSSWPLPPPARDPIASAVLVSPTLRWKVQLAPHSLVATPLHGDGPTHTLPDVLSYMSLTFGPHLAQFEPAPRWAAKTPILVAAGSKSILRWDVEHDTTDRLALDGRPESLAISPDGSLVAALTTDGKLHLLGQQARILGDVAPHSYLVFSPDNHHVAACGISTRVFALTGALDLPSGTACAFTPDNNAIIIATDTGLRYCTLATRACRDIAGSSGATTVRIAQSGRIVAQLGEGVIATWTSPDAPRDIIGRLRGALADLDLSADGNTLVTGSRGPEVVLWDLSTNTSRTLRGPIGHIDEVWLEPGNAVGVSDLFSVHRFIDDLPRSEAGLRAAITDVLR